ncbi:MAG: endonuclease III [Opitutales bacterium]|nr:endonuclease III [Opitutales bacterium]
MANKLQIILHYLDQAFPNPEPSLQASTPFEILIATLLSAQCHDEQVNRVMPNLMNAAHTPQEMRKVPEATLQKLIYSCGFFRNKARAIKALSEQLCERFNGEVPCTFDDLESLPRVGHKTASVVMGHAFGQFAFPVDTHIHRLALKWGLSKGPNVERVERDLKRIFPQNDWFKRHLQLILFGRAYCNRTQCKPEHLCCICKALQEL